MNEANITRTEFSTHQPFQHPLMAHVGCCVQTGHAIVGPQVDVSPTLVHKVLCNIQVSLLTGQVERGGTNGRLAVHAPALQQQGRTRFSCKHHSCRYPPILLGPIQNTLLNKRVEHLDASASDMFWSYFNHKRVSVQATSSISKYYKLSALGYSMSSEWFFY